VTGAGDTQGHVHGGPAPDAPAPGDGAADGLELAAEPLPAHEELERTRAERDEYLDGLRRMKAEFENFRKRMERERVHQRAAAAREVVATVLPVLDNLERAVAALRQQDDGLAEGVEMVRGQLGAVLAGHGLAEVEALGRPFDPNVHEAVASIPVPDAVEGTVVEVVEKGYRSGDDLLRAAKVVVAAGG
jgi:molecular chaperone GrpE